MGKLKTSPKGRKCKFIVIFIEIRFLGRNRVRFHIIILHKLIADDLTDDEAQAQIKELQKLCDSIVKPS
jgi:hypothetical protein